MGHGLGAGNETDEGLQSTEWSWVVLGGTACSRQGQIWGRCPCTTQPVTQAPLGSHHPWEVSVVLGTELSVAICFLWSWQNLQRSQGL